MHSTPLSIKTMVTTTDKLNKTTNYQATTNRKRHYYWVVYMILRVKQRFTIIPGVNISILYTVNFFSLVCKIFLKIFSLGDNADAQLSEGSFRPETWEPARFVTQEFFKQILLHSKSFDDSIQNMRKNSRILKRKWFWLKKQSRFLIIKCQRLNYE